MHAHTHTPTHTHKQMACECVFAYGMCIFVSLCVGCHGDTLSSVLANKVLMLRRGVTLKWRKQLAHHSITHSRSERRNIGGNEHWRKEKEKWQERESGSCGVNQPLIKMVMLLARHYPKENVLLWCSSDMASIYAQNWWHCFHRLPRNGCLFFRGNNPETNHQNRLY